MYRIRQILTKLKNLCINITYVFILVCDLEGKIMGKLAWVMIFFFYGCAAFSPELALKKKEESLSRLGVRKEGVTLSGDWVGCVKTHRSSDLEVIKVRFQNLAFREAQKLAYNYFPVFEGSHGYLGGYFCARFSFERAE